MDLTKLIKIPKIGDHRGNLTIIEGQTSFCPFEIKRVFTVFASSGSIRGNHAHKKCTQLMVCLAGSIDICCDNTIQKETFCLNEPHQALLIEPTIWATQEYKNDNSILAVFCDMKYDETDYIRDYTDLIRFKKLSI